MDLAGPGACIFPQQLQGAVLRVPRNVTRFSRNAFRLCGAAGSGPRTAVVYLMDHSFSMTYPTIDPTGIAAGAFHAALRRQAAIDSGSVAGYIPFSTGILGDTVAPAPLDSAQLARLTTAIHSTYDGNTNYIAPFELAQQWLARPEYDGWNKLVIFLSDGAPNEGWLPSAQLLYQPDFPAVHGIYLGTSNTDEGIKVVDFLSWLTRDPRDASPGTFHHITTVDELAPVIDQLVQTYVYTATPTSMELVHQQTQVAIAVDQQQLLDLGDTSFSVIMDNNMPLVRGTNTLVLRSTYSAGAPIEISFTVQVSDTIMNRELELQGAPFQTSCYDYNGMTILDSRRLQSDLLDRTDDRCYVQFTTEASNNYGDSLSFQLSAGSGDRQSFAARLQATEADSGFVLYEAEVPLQWMASPTGGDQRLQLDRLDTIDALWQHPDDQRDAIGARQRAFWRLPKLDTLAYFDDDHDGHLDRLSAEFATALHASDLPLLEWKLPWIGALSDTVLLAAPRNLTAPWTPADSLLTPHLSADSLRLEWSLPQDSLDLRTGLEGLAPAQLVRTSARPDWRAPDTLTPIQLDRMAPLLRRARVLVDQQRDENPVDTLRLFFTETIDWAGSGEIPLFDFQVRLPGARHHEQRPAYDYTAWFLERPAELRAMMSERRNADFRVHPGDSVRMRSDVPALRDLAGNLAWEENPYVYIDGTLRALVVHTVLGEADPDALHSDTAITAHVLPGGTNLEDWLEERGTLGVGWGPIKVARDETDPAKLTFPWSVEIYDIQGQYVARASGVLDCREPAFEAACRDEDGISLAFEWNYRSESGREAGSGVYLFRARLAGDEQLLRLGVRRNSVR
jgi:hypothetical protein